MSEESKKKQAWVRERRGDSGFKTKKNGRKYFFLF